MYLVKVFVAVVFTLEVTLLLSAEARSLVSPQHCSCDYSWASHPYQCGFPVYCSLNFCSRETSAMLFVCLA